MAIQSNLRKKRCWLKVTQKTQTKNRIKQLRVNDCTWKNQKEKAHGNETHSEAEKVTDLKKNQKSKLTTRDS